MRLWTLDKLQEIALKFSSRAEWKDRHGASYAAAVRLKVLGEVCRHMEKKTGFWTEDAISKEASKYASVREWRKLSPRSYSAACKKGLISKLTKGKTRSVKSYSDQDLIEIAKQYKTRAEWAKADRSSYVVARNRGVADRACSHMGYVAGTSQPELDLMSEIRAHYPKAQKLNVSVKDSQFLPAKGFSLDIYIPELRKGIEFNGEYWHSFEGLARSRKKLGWTDEQIKNYHALKDAFFRYKNIEVLHIKESDWKTRKDWCVDQVFSFLSSGGANGQA